MLVILKRLTARRKILHFSYIDLHITLYSLDLSKNNITKLLTKKIIIIVTAKFRSFLRVCIKADCDSEPLLFSIMLIYHTSIWNISLTLKKLAIYKAKDQRAVYYVLSATIPRK
jgi:hypothetical protein